MVHPLKGRLMTERERREFSAMLHYALVAIRNLCERRRSRQAADLTTAFYNLPTHIGNKEFTFDFVYDLTRFRCQEYERKYPANAGWVKWLDKIAAGKIGMTTEPTADKLDKSLLASD